MEKHAAIKNADSKYLILLIIVPRSNIFERLFSKTFLYLHTTEKKYYLRHSSQMFFWMSTRRYGSSPMGMVWSISAKDPQIHETVRLKELIWINLNQFKSNTSPQHQY